MAYRRKQGMPKPLMLNDEIGTAYPPSPPDNSSSSSSASSLAAKAIRASSAYRDSSLSSAYGQSAVSSPRDSNPRGSPSPSLPKNSTNHEYASLKSDCEPRQGFWGVLARKAKAMLDDDNAAEQLESSGRTRLQMPDTVKRSQYLNQNKSPESQQKLENPSLHKGLGAITSSLNYIGGTIGNALEEGLAMVENRTADIIQETRKLQVRRKGSSSEAQNMASNAYGTQPRSRQTPTQLQKQNDIEIQLKASRDVAMAMAAKAKLLLRELKTVRADLAFAKERCAQLEEENRILRESREKGDNPEDDDLVRLQLETLLAEKARLAQENSVFARENRFLREIVEYHQLTMQDVVYLDEGNEEVTEVYPIKVPSVTNFESLSSSSTITPSTSPPLGGSHLMNQQVVQDVSSRPVASAELVEVFQPVTPLSSHIHTLIE